MFHVYDLVLTLLQSCNADCNERKVKRERSREVLKSSVTSGVVVVL